MLNKRNQLATILLYINSGIIILLGIVYSSTTRLMPYHEKFLGKTQEQLDEKSVTLAIYSINLIGSLLLSIGGVLVILIRIPLSKGESWARWTVLGIILFALLPLLRITLLVGPFAPWWVIVLLITIGLTGLALYSNK